MYLASFNAEAYEADIFTQHVAWQTERLLQLFNADAYILPNPHEAGLKLIYNGKYIARIIEGCNALSVIILFIAFVVAFTGKLRPTVLFIVFGSILIHILNIGRIALLGYGLYHFPEQEHLMHSVLFPLFIYGVVFLLWIIWVNKFSSYAGKTV